jgi:hypothetical protein
MIVFICVVFVVLVYKIFSMIGEQEDRTEEICRRISNLEKDAVKITFDKKNEKKE